MTTKNITSIVTKDNRFSLKSELLGRFFILGIKISFFLILLALLYSQVFDREDMNFAALWNQIKNNLGTATAPLLIAVLLLMPLNWILEVQKWRSLMPNHAELTFFNAFKAVLAGLAVSLFTPNRIGEYGGRVLMVPKSMRIPTVWATIVGSFSQWIVLIVGGGWALVLALAKGWIDIHPNLLYLSIVLATIVTAALLWMYLNIQTMVGYTMRFKWTKKLAQTLSNGRDTPYSSTTLVPALGFSLGRYATYSTQYILLLLFFGFQANIVSMLLSVMIIYFLQTGIPLPPSTGLLARGNIALLVLGWIGTAANTSLIILASTFGLWMINVVFPAVIGGLFLLKATPLKKPLAESL